MNKNTLQLPYDINIKVDKKQLINQLRAMNDSYINISISSSDHSKIMIYDRFNCNVMATKN